MNRGKCIDGPWEGQIKQSSSLVMSASEHGQEGYYHFVSSVWVYQAAT